MKYSKKLILLLCSLVMMLSVAICVYAAENNLTVPDCDYQIVSFNNGTATIECTDCGDTFTLDFVDYINGYNEYLDVHDDGIVNAKDFAKLNREYRK